MRSVFLIPALLFIRPSIAGYVLVDDYNPSTFFNMFDFFTGADPTEGAGGSLAFNASRCKVNLRTAIEVATRKLETISQSKYFQR